MISEGKIKQIVRSVLEEAYSEKLIQQLIDRFKEENPNLDDSILRAYIDRFQEIKNSPKVVNKDITTYSWNDLKAVVDYNQPDEIKIDGGEELIYDQNNLKIYLANTKRACVKYGTGYNFCISSRGEENLYHNYRFGEEGQSTSTIYFVIDEDKTKERKNEEEFKDPTHMLVIMVSESGAYNKKMAIGDPDDEILNYIVTTANNDGETRFDSIEEIADELQPKLHGLDHLFKFVSPNPKEHSYKKIYDEYEDKLIQLFQNANVDFDPTKGMIPFRLPDLMNKNSLQILFNYINNKPSFVYSITDYPEGELPMVYHDKIDPQKYLHYLEHNLAYDVSLEDTDDVKITEVLPTDENYVKYLHNTKELYSEFLHEKNKLNLQ